VQTLLSAFTALQEDYAVDMRGPGPIRMPLLPLLPTALALSSHLYPFFASWIFASLIDGLNQVWHLHVWSNFRNSNVKMFNVERLTTKVFTAWLRQEQIYLLVYPLPQAGTAKATTQLEQLLTSKLWNTMHFKLNFESSSLSAWTGWGYNQL
jgi:hypothetical protein